MASYSERAFKHVQQDGMVFVPKSDGKIKGDDHGSTPKIYRSNISLRSSIVLSPLNQASFMHDGEGRGMVRPVATVKPSADGRAP